MAVTLRLTRRGQTKRPFYRVVAAEKSARRDGKFIEIVGTYNPLLDPPVADLKEDRVRHWIGQGAEQSKLVRSLIKKSFPGLVEEKQDHSKAKSVDRRKKRREAVKARKSTKKAKKTKSKTSKK